MYSRFRAALLLMGLLLWVMPYARADLITNGSFETPIVTDPQHVLAGITAGSEPAGFGWSVTSGSVDITVGGTPSPSFPLAFHGSQYLDLDGFVPGAIQQTFATSPGTTYVLTFEYANNPFGGGTNCVPPNFNPCATIPAHGTATIFDANNAAQLITPLVLTHGGSTATNANWTPSGNIEFAADGNMTTLSFKSNDPSNSNGGIFLDAISLNPVSAAVPEPRSFVLLFLGISCAGALYVRQRRRSDSPVCSSASNRV